MTGNFCGNYSTVTPASPPDVTAPTTIQVHGTTFTSGFAYLSYAGVTATGPDGNCGTTIPAGILPLPSSEVFSYRGHAAAMAIAGDIQYPFNFADLAPNSVPWAPWISQETCFTQQAYPQCQTITQAAYRPGIVYPSAFWSLNPQWSNCVSGIFGILDPPTALPTANAAVSPTYATWSVVSTTTAAPKQDPTQSTVRATSNSVDTSPKSSHDPAVRTSKSLDQPTGMTSTTGIPTTVLRTSRLSIGTLAIKPASGHGVVSIGTDLLSDGQATTIGRTVVSLDSNSLVFGVVESTSTAFSSPLNAVSVLVAAHTEGIPSAVFTVDGEAYTAYPGGMIAGESTTMYVAHHTALDIAGHSVSIGNGTIWVDSSSIAFEKPHRKGPHSSTDRSKTKEIIVATFRHESTRTTLPGYVDSAGNTIMKFGTKVLTCTGDIIVRDGTTYTIVGVSRDPTEQTSLPKIVSTGVSINGTLTATQRPAANTGAGPSTSTAKSASTASITSLDIAVPVIIYTMLLLQWF